MANVAASAASPQPGPTPATSRPPTDAPAIIAALMPSRLTALACLRTCSGTVWASNAEVAGKANALTTPLIDPRIASQVTVASPVSTKVATAPWLNAANAHDHTITTCRGRRSATSPPKRVNTTFATDRAPTTRPRSRAEPVRSSTAKASAIGATALPSMFTTRPAAR